MEAGIAEVSTLVTALPNGLLGGFFGLLGEPPAAISALRLARGQLFFLGCFRNSRRFVNLRILFRACVGDGIAGVGFCLDRGVVVLALLAASGCAKVGAPNSMALASTAAVGTKRVQEVRISSPWVKPHR
ncbi:hypothetical protein LP417_14200 [Polaromonas sp. P1-6]|nr:hypothetical protein LP417_14200 [Polaromonas sp. P1-6]